MAPLAATLAARLLRPDLLAEIAADEMVELAFDSADNDVIFCDGRRICGMVCHQRRPNESPRAHR